MGFRSAFSFYGGKSKILDFYPAPKHDLIIEPFAGGGSYSLRHGEGRSVWLNDADPKVYGMWTFLRDDLPAWVERIPARVGVGDRASELVPGAPEGLVSIMQAEANQGTQGARGTHDQVTSMGAKCWPRIKDKLQWAHEKVQGWQITNLPYDQVIPNPGAFDLPFEVALSATWFIDPPYDNPAGRRYRQQVVDYGRLRDYCLSRKGQVIVCENQGATWLPFEPVVARRGIRSRYQKSNANEAIYTLER
jgi:site-specific DNA-adenine methylase